MTLVERKKPTLKVGDVVNVRHINLEGGVLLAEQMVVDEAGQPQVLSQVGRVQLIETRFQLRPLQADEVTVKTTK